MGMPCRSMKALEKLLLASSWAARAEGPKQATPSAVRASTTPGRGGFNAHYSGRGFALRLQQLQSSKVKSSICAFLSNSGCPSYRKGRAQKHTSDAFDEDKYHRAQSSMVSVYNVSGPFTTG